MGFETEKETALDKETRETNKQARELQKLRSELDFRGRALQCSIAFHGKRGMFGSGKSDLPTESEILQTAAIFESYLRGGLAPRE